jgi:Divergent InlB B-repeat domain
MRLGTTLLGLLILSGCGDDGGGPIDPGGGEGFTLTITGQGTGSGRVTAPGATTAIDCSLVANAEPVGTCAATYAEGSAVSLTANPEPGSIFAGWSGAASSCETGTSCLITMSGNLNAVADFSAAPSSDAVQITSSAWYPDPDFGGSGTGAIVWVVEVRNTSSQVVDLVRVDFNSRDAAGNILTSDFLFIGPIPPGETRANESLTDFLGTETAADIQVTEAEFGTEDPGFGVAQIVSSNWQVDPDFDGEGAVVWTVEVQNTGTQELESVRIDFITYNAAGQILAHDLTFVEAIPPGETRPGEGFAELRGGETSVNYQVAEVIVAEEPSE